MNPGRIQQARELVSRGRLDAAKALLLRAVQADPGDAHANSLLRVICGREGDHVQALFYARRAAAAAPGDYQMMVALGDTLCINGQHEEGTALLRRAAPLAPGDPLPRVSIARALFGVQDFDGGIRECRDAIEQGLDHPELRRLWAFALVSMGRAAEGVAVLEQADRLHPGDATRLAQLASLMNYHESATPEQVTQAHARYAAAQMLAPFPGPAPRAQGPDRKLRIGFVSADLRTHSVPTFAEPLFEGLDRNQFELCAYSAAALPDAVTRRLRRSFSLWRDVPATGPYELAAMIRADRVDIAIDLGGVADPQRLAVFALRAAPVQVTYLAYPNTTGVPAMDARIVDSLTDPPGSEPLASERLMRLDPCFLCYRPPADTPAVSVRPQGNPIVFASCNVMLKINARVLDVWARVLAATPGSRMLIKNPGATAPAVRALIDRALAAGGVDPARVETRGLSPTLREHLEVFAGVDIALDPFPYNGTTSTCESLYMGVPVVALQGDRHAARVGVSLLSVVGLSDLIAKDEEAYIAIAAALAGDRERLADLRGHLRSRVLGSPLCDERAYAARFGAVLRGLWQDACSAG